jgi:hypothetical protein
MTRPSTLEECPEVADSARDRHNVSHDRLNDR